jgi:hypothetical protein
MKQYLLSVCYPASGSRPPPAELNKIMSDVVALQRKCSPLACWSSVADSTPPVPQRFSATNTATSC